MGEQDDRLRISKKELTSLYPKLGASYYNYFKDLIEGGASSLKEMCPLYNELVRSQPQLDTATINQLEFLSQEAEKTQDTRILQARTSLQRYFAYYPRGRELRHYGIHLIVYGSIQYADPKNLDADLLGVASSSQPFSQSQELASEKAIVDDLIKLWSQKNLGLTKRAEPHLRLTYLDYLKDIVKNIGKDTEIFHYDTLDLPVLLTGRHLFRHSIPWLKHLKAQAKNIIQTDQLLIVLTNMRLRECLKERLTRRAQMVDQSNSHNHLLFKEEHV